MTFGVPTVNVPVLSNVTFETAANRSKASPSRTRKPCLVAFPIAAMIAAGVASTNAQGQNTTKIVTARTICPVANHVITAALAGCVIGYVVGAVIGKLLFNILIQEHFAYAVWTLPVFRLLIVVVFVVAAMLAAIYTPSKRMRNMAVTETINEL